MEGLRSRPSEVDGSSANQHVSLCTVTATAQGSDQHPLLILWQSLLAASCHRQQTQASHPLAAVLKQWLRWERHLVSILKVLNHLRHHVWPPATQAAPTRCWGPQWLSHFRKPIAVLLWVEAFKKASTSSVSCWKPAERSRTTAGNAAVPGTPKLPCPAFQTGLRKSLKLLRRTVYGDREQRGRWEGRLPEGSRQLSWDLE